MREFFEDLLSSVGCYAFFILVPVFLAVNPVSGATDFPVHR